MSWRPLLFSPNHSLKCIQQSGYHLPELINLWTNNNIRDGKVHDPFYSWKLWFSVNTFIMSPCIYYSTTTNNIVNRYYYINHSVNLCA